MISEFFLKYKQWKARFDILSSSDLKDIPNTFVTTIEGKSIAFTGWIPISRKDLIKLIKKCGGKIMSNVNQECEILICGERPGMKLFQANELKSTILFYVELGQMLKVYD